jgi:acyl carrier protein
MMGEDTATEAKVGEWLEGIARSRLPEPPALGPDSRLIDLGLMDSLAVFELVAQIEGELGVAVPHEALVPENFGTPAALARMVEDLKAGAG